MTLLIAWPGSEAQTRGLAATTGSSIIELQTRRFPDGEIYLRLLSSCAGQSVAVVAALDRPDEKTPGLLALADALRAEGATRVGLVAPYLAYLRQDRQFNPGEAVTSRTYARLLSSTFDWLLTVDPHLHRYHSLSEIYSIPTRVVHAAPAIADWIGRIVNLPLLIGPDGESAQWVSDIAARINAPWTTLEKTRRGDRDVEVSIPHIDQSRGRTPVLADDIISSGRTMLAAVKRLREAGTPTPICVGVHAIFAGDAYDALLAAGPRIVTCNTIAHPSNEIDLSSMMGAAADEFLAAKPAH
ncbi:MAG: ribose-phosphate pyrophosphokinase [Planctomycetes bacterium]|nr:ribose-phosphate pyrophosphokinase [Planctomycetota bacterium]